MTEDGGEVAIADMSVPDALKNVLKKALMFDGLRRGLHECIKHLDGNTARLCCLAADCDNPEITKLIRALCKENGTHIIMVKTRQQLGILTGLCKIDSTGEPTKIVPCSVAVVLDFGIESHSLTVLTEHLAKGGE
mmetsp:Transcript_4827/g.7318  ORF Transcript_4827/g.7318 Transcript_4827/m.7318 type:complete len:135 (+) Transcript_4827:84-488(+)|eukprot:CAMPEP_0171456012 /NCGR_PEP_ID=MMETSP0945-20130129/2676_1 /TAXON_ID=109269 /ORGANISM="Vaucheria litorea, Strain CCMP2940" /LENGTH=134 /DNA_ID=CAMNT_0011981365 /DNA_START=52 /DNA_END=456 /DNA_ORIENTATION=-